MNGMPNLWRVGSPPIKARVASAIYWTLDHICVWTGHIRGCWLLNRSPASDLWQWAADHDVRCWRRGEYGWEPPESAGKDVTLTQTWPTR